MGLGGKTDPVAALDGCAGVWVSTSSVFLCTKWKGNIENNAKEEEQVVDNMAYTAFHGYLKT